MNDLGGVHARFVASVRYSTDMNIAAAWLARNNLARWPKLLFLYIREIVTESSSTVKLNVVRRYKIFIIDVTRDIY